MDNDRSGEGAWTEEADEDPGGVSPSGEAFWEGEVDEDSPNWKSGRGSGPGMDGAPGREAKAKGRFS